MSPEPRREHQTETSPAPLDGRRSTPRRPTRRDALRLLTMGAGAALLAACGNQATQAPQAGPKTDAAAGPTPAGAASKSGAQAGGQPRSGGTLRMGFLGDLNTLDGHWVTGTNTISPVWDRLVSYDEKLTVLPGLAESWDVNGDYSQVKLTLRKGVQFHTGREFTSEDARWNLERIKTDKKIDGGAKANFVTSLASMETPDKSTLIIKSDKPWPGMFDILSWINMIDPATFQEPGGEQKPVGTGPFTFVEYVQGDHITLKKNPSYWQSGKPYLDGIDIKIFADAQSMVAQLEGGALDLVHLPSYQDTARLQKDSRYRVSLHDYSGTRFVVLAQSKDPAAPTGNQQFRQALNYAIDRKRWVETGLVGIGAPVSLPWAPSSPAYDAAKDSFYTFDLDKAKSLIDASGVSGREVEFLYNANRDPHYARVAQLYQADLAKIGVTLTIKGAEAVQYVDMLYNSKFTGLCGAQTLFGQLHPGMLAGNPYFSAGSNWASFRSEELTRLGNGLAFEADPAKQKQVYSAWNDYVLDQAWAMVWATNPPRVAATTRVRGLAFNMAEFMMTNDVWLDA